MNSNSLLVIAGIGLTSFPLVLGGCGSDSTNNSGSSTSSGGTVNDAGVLQPNACGAVPPATKPAASCDVTIELPPLVPVGLHQKEGTQIEYCSNPPSSGPHYGIWAAFQEFTKPVDYPYLVHSMEHGAVLLLYKCDQACPEVVDQLRKVRDAIPTDPTCDAATRVRIIIAPSPTLKTQVAAAAWGATYQAPCVDAPSLTTFVNDHYRKGPEDLCVPGQTF